MEKQGFIYALMHNQIPFYIGQTIDPDSRNYSHMACCRLTRTNEYQNKNLYDYIRKLDNGYDDVTFHIVKKCPISQLKDEEKKTIYYCLKIKNIDLLNNCHYSRKLKGLNYFEDSVIETLRLKAKQNAEAKRIHRIEKSHISN